MGWICRCGEGLDDDSTKCWNCGKQRPAASAAPSGIALPIVGAEVFAAPPTRQALPSLPDEKVLATLNGKMLILTSHRLRSETYEFGRATLISIMLEEVASSAITSLTKPILLIMGAIFGLLGFLAIGSSSRIFVGGLVIGGCFVLAYFLTQKRVLSFASAGAAINVAVGDYSDDDAHRFLENVEQAKHARNCK